MRIRRALLISGLSGAFLLGSSTGGAATISSGFLIEDFSSLTGADISGTTGVWNAASGIARLAAFADANASKPIDFGDGHDGVIETSAGYHFDTDAHPEGFNFISLKITGGPVTVSGSHALVIRSLGDVVIASPISLQGTDGQNGRTLGLATTAPLPGRAVTCSAHGGAGGFISGMPSDGDGSDGKESSGIPEAGAFHGTLNTAGGWNGGVDSGEPFSGPASGEFESAGNFICGTGGSGGGAYSFGGNTASGAAGGGGGGRIRVAAVGNVSVHSINASGGNGGNGADFAGADCSGIGGAGIGGAVWLQALGTLSSAVAPNVDSGTSGSSACAGAGLPASLTGFRRGDSAPGQRPAWPGGTHYDTDRVPANTSSVILSKGYDLGTWNAGFFGVPTISQTLNGGSIAVQYSGSADNVMFSGFVSDITSLSNQGYRYLRFKISMTSAPIATASPEVTAVAVPYEDLGLRSLEFNLSSGCGTVDPIKRKPADDLGGMLTMSFWMLMTGIAYCAVRTERAGATKEFPASS
jgi:hypothetical protein